MFENIFKKGEKEDGDVLKFRAAEEGYTTRYDPVRKEDIFVTENEAGNEVILTQEEMQKHIEMKDNRETLKDMPEE
jgi:hypothetical protein